SLHRSVSTPTTVHQSAYLTPISITPSPPSYIPTLSLHDALPIYEAACSDQRADEAEQADKEIDDSEDQGDGLDDRSIPHCITPRSEEHTSELQSRFDLVCRLLLEKKKCILT